MSTWGKNDKMLVLLATQLSREKTMRNCALILIVEVGMGVLERRKPHQ